jgi:hypothetical protein
MPTKKTALGPKVPPVVVAVVKPVTKRLSGIEDLLVEIRAEQDRHLKQITKLQIQFDALSPTVEEHLSRASVGLEQ